MEITELYATAAGGVFLAFIVLNFVPYLKQLEEPVRLFIAQHLTYPFLIRRHRFLGPWTRAVVLAQSVYTASNLFCICFRVKGLSEAGDRAGTLSLINMIPVFAGPHLSFLADVLGVSLTTYRLIHRSASLMTYSLVVFHVFAVVVHRPLFSLAVAQNRFGLIVR